MHFYLFGEKNNKILFYNSQQHFKTYTILATMATNLETIFCIYFLLLPPPPPPPQAGISWILTTGMYCVLGVENFDLYLTIFCLSASLVRSFKRIFEGILNMSFPAKHEELMVRAEIKISTLFKARALEWLFGSGVWGSAGIYIHMNKSIVKRSDPQGYLER